MLCNLMNKLKTHNTFYGKRWTPLAVAHSWHRDGLEEILTPRAHGQSPLALPPSPYLCLPFMSIVKIAR